MLLDCIRKTGKTLTPADRDDLKARFQDHKSAGLSDYDAGIATLGEYHRRIFDSVNDLRSAAGLVPAEYLDPLAAGGAVARAPAQAEARKAKVAQAAPRSDE